MENMTTTLDVSVLWSGPPGSGSRRSGPRGGSPRRRGPPSRPARSSRVPAAGPVRPHELLDPDADEADLLALRVLPRVEERLQQPAHLVLQRVLAPEGHRAGVGPAPGLEAREADRHRHGPERLEPLGAEPPVHPGAHAARALQHEDGVE